jgi:23S rRNA (cytosine1962-C5)-methyltransferase
MSIDPMRIELTLRRCADSVVTMFDRTLMPTPGERRLAVRVSPDALRQIRGGHPWVFENAIRSVNFEGEAGDLAVIFDDDRKFAAIGVHDPDSPIRIRILHVGKPVTINDEWFSNRLDTAIERRSSLAVDPATNAYRIVHGENDGWPGLVVDRYADVLVMKLYAASWLRYLPTLVDLLVAKTGVSTVVLRLSREVSRGNTYGLVDGDTLFGEPPAAPVEFLENGLLFEADVIRGNKTGHFLDQRENRAFVRELSNGARVLDVFSCTGGFSVSAMAGGAAYVHSTDLNPHALETAQRNMARNGFDASQHTVTVGDAFEVMERLDRSRERFDVVIVDPPSFARKATEVAGALAAYARLTTRAIRLIEPGGVLVQSSCSSRVATHEFYGALWDAAEATGRPLQEFRRTEHAVDHPTDFAFGRYLKTIYARV